MFVCVWLCVCVTVRVCLSQPHELSRTAHTQSLKVLNQRCLRGWRHRVVIGLLCVFADSLFELILFRFARCNTEPHWELKSKKDLSGLAWNFMWMDFGFIHKHVNELLALKFL